MLVRLCPPTSLYSFAYPLIEIREDSVGPDLELLSIGGDERLNLVITDYTPRVRCDKTATPGPPWESCLVIIHDMLVTKGRHVFGDKSQDPRVDVNLPQYFKASKQDP